MGHIHIQVRFDPTQRKWQEKKFTTHSLGILEAGNRMKALPFELFKARHLWKQTQSHEWHIHLPISEWPIPLLTDGLYVLSRELTLVNLDNLNYTHK